MSDQNLERKRMIKSWIALHEVEQDSLEYESNFWAFERLDELIREHPDLGWQAILDILQMDISDRVFSNLAAGPLEDLLSEHGERFIEKVEKESGKNAKFKKLLGGVWQNAMSDDIWSRVQAVAGERW